MLRSARISQEEREILRRSTGTTVGGKKSATVPLLPNEVFGMGRFGFTVGDESIEGDVQALAVGIQLPATPKLFASVVPWGAHGDTTYAVAREISIGGVTIGPVPVLLVPGLRVARVGLDVLGQLTPTFDFAGQTLTVGAPHGAREGAERWPVLLTFPGVTFVTAEGTAPVALHATAGRAAVRGLRWTLNLGLGAIVIER
jgi:hypothetical protein